MKKYCYFTQDEFLQHLDEGERLKVAAFPDLKERLNEWMVRMSIIRAAFGQPIRVNSWYRDHDHNKRVGGSATSQHLDGTAVDITSSDNAKLMATICRIQKEGMDFGQVIAYGSGQYRFLHLSLPTRDKLNQYLNFP